MPLQIASPKITLSVPLMAADFDPQDSRYLVVGGGGGEGRTGVGNKISLLDTSDPDKLTEIQEVELSPDEDSVTSLCVAHSDQRRLVAFAGVNNSQEEMDQDSNQHLRSYELIHEAGEEKLISEKVDAATATLSKTALFRPGPQVEGVPRETYQKTLRLSPLQDGDASGSRIGVVATGMEPQGEIVVFKAASEKPSESDVITRLRLRAGEEAEDVDIYQLSEGKFRIAYTNTLALYTFDISLASSSSPVAPPEPKMFYSVPKPPPERPLEKTKIRNIKFCSPSTFVVLQNLPDRTGSELVLVTNGEVRRRKRLNKGMKMALGMDICPLPALPTGERQFIVAVSGSNHAIEVYTVDYRGGDGKKSYGSFKRYTLLKDVHTFTITKIVLSPFVSPSSSSIPNKSTPKPPTVKIASVSVGNTVVVHHLPLLPYPSKQDTQRYVLTNPTTSSYDAATIFISGTVALQLVILTAVLLQAFNEIRGSVPPTLGAKDWLHPRIRDAIARPYSGSSILKATPAASVSVLGEEMPVLDVTTTITPETFDSKTLSQAFSEEQGAQPEGKKRVLVDTSKIQEAFSSDLVGSPSQEATIVPQTSLHEDEGLITTAPTTSFKHSFSDTNPGL